MQYICMVARKSKKQKVCILNTKLQNRIEDYNFKVQEIYVIYAGWPV